MRIKTFELERVQSLYENTVKYNLTESGFHPYSLNELLTEEQKEEVLSLTLGYGQTNGSIPLRKTIAGLYDNCHEDQIMVANGTCEANFIACHTLLESGDEVVMMVPNYMQIWGIAEEMGCSLQSFQLDRRKGWSPNLEELEAAMTDHTKLIVICNPNNPTGYTLTEAEMDSIIKIARTYGAWIYSDEVYRGAELNGKEIPSFFGRYEKVMVNGGLSKAYALPGLRLGWLAGPKNIIDDTWSYSDYTSITAGIMSHHVAQIALSEPKRSEILDRNRTMLNENLNLVKHWVDQFDGRMEIVSPKAGGMLFVKYDFPINSTVLSDWLRLEHNVLLLAGDVFGMDNYFRIGIGAEKGYLMNGLDIVAGALKGKYMS